METSQVLSRFGRVIQMVDRAVRRHRVRVGPLHSRLHRTGLRHNLGLRIQTEIVRGRVREAVSNRASSGMNTDSAALRQEKRNLRCR
jgi:hypothetical protein